MEQLKDRKIEQEKFYLDNRPRHAVDSPGADTQKGRHDKCL